MKQINYLAIKNIFKKNSLEVKSKVPESEIFKNIKTISKSTHDDLTFFSNIKYMKDLNNTKAKACLIEEKFIKFLPNTCHPIIVNEPYLALAILTNIFADNSIISNGEISNKAIINSKAKIGNNVQINAFTTINENVVINDNVYIGSSSNIGPNVEILKNVTVHDNVSISNAKIMENCEIQSGARIGGDGFGFDMKTKQKISHIGNVLIKNNTSIGSNTTIDRAVFDSTVIGKFSNIDNLVQIAHNVTIGDFATIAAQVGIAGSTDIGKYVKIGGQAGISGHLVIGDNVTIAAKSGVTKNISDNKIIAGFPAKDINLWKKEIIRNSIKK